MAADPSSKVPIGTLLVGKYRITREIGRGGMAVVYEAENIHIGKRVAVKVLSAELISSRVVRERFFREARAAAAVRSPYICDVYDAGEFDTRPFLVMELLEGESLYDLMSSVRRMDPEQTLKIIVQTAKGLAKAHAAHVVHRDLKPENLFLTHNEEGELITKLLDFGLAKFYVPSDESAEQVRLTREGALFGTPAYMSPEQARGKGEVDHRSDLWALGCIVYECLTGQTVWNVDQGVAMILAQVANAPLPVPSQLRPDLPPAFDAWFEKALERDQDKRFQTAREFALALTEVLNPAAKSSVQTPSLLVDVDDLTSRIGVGPGDERAPLSARLSSSATPSNPRNSRSLAVQPHGTSAEPGPILGATAPPGRARSGGGLVALVVVAAAAGGLFYGYRSWRHIPVPASYSIHQQSSAPSSAGADRGKSGLDGAPYAESVYRAQDALAKGDAQQALAELDVAIRNGGEGLATNLRSHVRAALDASSGPCHLAGLARPRPFNANTTEDVTRPSVIDSPPGIIFGWAQHQVFTTLLDSRLRSKDKPFSVAPEAANARHPQLVRIGNQLNLLFWNGLGSEPGVFVRALSEDGKITGPIRKVGPIGHGSYSPSMAAAPDGTSWVVWEDDSVDGVTNLVARHLDHALTPIGNIVQLTSLKPDRLAKPGAVKPSVAVAAGRLNVAFVIRRQNVKRALWMSIELTSTELQSGLTPSKGKAAAKERFLGKVRPLDNGALPSEDSRAEAGAALAHKPGQSPQSSDDVRLSCASNYCVVAWNDTNSMQVAYLDAQSGDSIWKRSIGKHGQHGALFAQDNEAAIAWYEASRVQFAIATRSGLSDPSIVAKVSGTGVQPYPEVAASRTAHEWYVAWRDYESGHFEAMLARAACTSRSQ